MAGWIRLSSQASSSPAVFAPALGVQAGHVTAAYAADGGHGIEVAGFSATPGDPGTVTRTDPLTDWTDLSGVFLLPGTTDTEQLYVSGTHSNADSDPLDGLDELAQQPGGSFGPPTSVGSSANSTAAGSVAPAAGGQSLLWTDNGLLGVENNATNPPTEEPLTYPTGATLEFTTDATLATDTSGRLWLAWEGGEGANAPLGIYLLQLDPQTGASLPEATPQLAPDSSSATNGGNLLLACSATCHVVYTPIGSPTRLVSWAPGQTTPVTVVSVGAHSYVGGVAVAAAADGRLWVVYETAAVKAGASAAGATADAIQLDSKLGDANGAGGTPTVSPAAVKGAVAYDGRAVATPSGLVVAADWVTTGKSPASGEWATVVRAP